MKKKILYFLGIVLFLVVVTLVAHAAFLSFDKNRYPIHKGITVTIFWVGEEASKDNNISNIQSAWDSKWQEHFGGFDDPKNRNGYYPAKFVPEENPFYFALPYNDLEKNGERKKNATDVVYWAGEKKEWRTNESMCKNRWVKIIKGKKTVYAQWEDVGPFGENDEKYVFGTSNPKSYANQNAGLDVSPAVRDYLALSDIDKVSWQFIDGKYVPEGPWKEITTIRQLYWD